MPDTITLVKLHAVIQESMSWWNSHLHEFEIAGLRYGMTDFDWDLDLELINEARMRLLKVLNHRSWFEYLYDFGDFWLHRITLAKALPMIKLKRYAICFAGENARPPEDVGGVPGYYDFLNVISNPDHENDEQMLEWYGGSFNPEFFDIDATNANLKRIKL